MFIAMVWLAFLARVRPVSTKAKPTCMNMTRKPQRRVHTRLMEIRLWPTLSAIFSAVSELLPAFARPEGIPVVAAPESAFVTAPGGWEVDETGEGISAGYTEEVINNMNRMTPNMARYF